MTQIKGYIILTNVLEPVALILYKNKDGKVTNVGFWKDVSFAVKIGTNKATEIVTIPVVLIEGTTDEKWDSIKELISKYNK